MKKRHAQQERTGDVVLQEIRRSKGELSAARGRDIDRLFPYKRVGKMGSAGYQPAPLGNLQSAGVWTFQTSSQGWKAGWARVVVLKGRGKLARRQRVRERRAW